MSTPSTITLRALAEDIRASFDCNCEVEDEFARAEDCPCAGDDCWKCAAAQALANDNESAEVAALREKLATASAFLDVAHMRLLALSMVSDGCSIKRIRDFSDKALHDTGAPGWTTEAARTGVVAKDSPPEVSLAPTPGPVVPGGRP